MRTQPTARHMALPRTQPTARHAAQATTPPPRRHHPARHGTALPGRARHPPRVRHASSRPGDPRPGRAGPSRGNARAAALPQARRLDRQGLVGVRLPVRRPDRQLGARPGRQRPRLRLDPAGQEPEVLPGRAWLQRRRPLVPRLRRRRRHRQPRQPRPGRRPRHHPAPGFPVLPSPRPEDFDRTNPGHRFRPPCTGRVGLVADHGWRGPHSLAGRPRRIHGWPRRDGRRTRYDDQRLPAAITPGNATVAVLGTRR